MKPHGIEAGTRLLFDTVALIYYFEEHRKYGRQAEELVRLVEKGKVSALVSTLLLAELLVMPYRQGRAEMAKQLVAELTAFPNLEVLPVDILVASEAARLQASYGLRTPDAMHAATALTAQVDLFITNDHQLRCLEKEKIRVWLFDEHVA